jgi:hydroxymethylpyrimidine/phosphomethylpyrimidine kinase
MDQDHSSVIEPIPAPIPAKALTIAGSDSGGGAGIQADLKTFGALGVYGSSAITAITAQNTLGVTAVHEIPLDVITAQIDAVMGDIGAEAVKTGMLSSPEIVRTVARAIERHQIDRLVVDPVMIAKSGHRLLHEEAVEAVRRDLLPLAMVVTPNVPEAEVLAGGTIATKSDMLDAARLIREAGPSVVIVKGGHLEGAPLDVVWDGETANYFETPRVNTSATHGTGCTYSAAITAGLAQGRPVLESIERARTYLFEALKRAYRVGAGHSPVHHFHDVWRNQQDETD